MLDFLDKQLPPTLTPLELCVQELEKQLAEKQAQVVVTQTHGFWETVETYGGYNTERGKVPGGWMLRMTHRYREETDKQPAPTPTFIADPTHSWVVTDE